MILKQVPKPEEVSEAISKFITTPRVEDYFKRRGILLATNRRAEFGNLGQHLFLDYDDYIALHNLTTKTSSGRSIAGFEIDLSKADEEIDLFFAIEEWSNRNQGKIEGLVYEDEILSGEYHYSRRTPGKYELVGSVESDVRFEVRRLRSRKWDLRFFPQKVTDKKQFEDLIKGAVGTKHEVIIPKLSDLSQSKRVEFYDLLLQKKYNEWQIDDVVGLKVKEPEALPEDDGIESDSEKQEDVEEKALGSIREAVLKGGNLRTNAFVKQLEETGYHFQSMTFKLIDSKTRLKTINVMVRFKLRPVGLEITVSNTEEHHENTPDEFVLSKSEQTGVLEIFWQKSNSVLKKLHR